ncbi:MAG: hypothetical protein QGI45_16855, partial [Myxococcota bacterium]|nr:hypothetical protein [Myxococcota bacterium]
MKFFGKRIRLKWLYAWLSACALAALLTWGLPEGGCGGESTGDRGNMDGTSGVQQARQGINPEHFSFMLLDFDEG